MTYSDRHNGAKYLLETLIKENSYRIRIVENEKGKSDVWRKFWRVVLDNLYQPYAQCKRCYCLIAYSGKTGTGSLIRHVCSQSRINTLDLRHRIDEADGSDIGPPTGSGSVSVSGLGLGLGLGMLLTASERDSNQIRELQKLSEIAQAEIDFLVRDLRPLQSVDDPGFRKLAQVLINVGAEYGRQSVDDILVGRCALDLVHIPRTYDTVKASVTNIFEANEVAVAVDLWTDNFWQRNLVTLTGYAVTDTFKIQSFMLGTREYTPNEIEHGLQRCVISIISDYTDDLKSAKLKMKDTIFVGGNDSTIMDTLENNYSIIPCSCTLINSTLDHILSSSGIEEIVADAKKLAIHIQESHLDTKLKVPTYLAGSRWNCIFSMLKWIHDSFDDIEELLLAQEDIQHIGCANRSVITELVEFLELFKLCSESLSANLSPTINEVVLWKMKVKRYCESRTSSTDIMKSLCQETLTYLNVMFTCSPIHYAALLLDPNFKSMKLLTSSEKAEALAAVAELFKTCKFLQNIPEASKESPHLQLQMTNTIKKEPDLDNIEFLSVVAKFEDTPSAEAAPPTKKSRLSTALKFREFLESNSDGEEERGENYNQELRYYQHRKFTSYDDDILEFWKTAGCEFPHLQRLARKVLAVPATSTFREKLFNKSSRLIDECRSQLGSVRDIDRILFLHHNMSI